MNFLEECYKLFEKTSKTHDLSKDINNYNKALVYLKNFYTTEREVIENFIVNVRLDNQIAAIIELLAKVQCGPISTLSQIPIDNLYAELQGEIPNLIMKGALDSIKLLNGLNDEQTNQLATRFYNCDLTIFDEYKTE